MLNSVELGSWDIVADTDTHLILQLRNPILIPEVAPVYGWPSSRIRLELNSSFIDLLPKQIAKRLVRMTYDYYPNYHYSRLNLAQRLCDKVLLPNDGEIIGLNTPEESVANSPAEIDTWEEEELPSSDFIFDATNMDYRSINTLLLWVRNHLREHRLRTTGILGRDSSFFKNSKKELLISVGIRPLICVAKGNNLDDVPVETFLNVAKNYNFLKTSELSPGKDGDFTESQRWRIQSSLSNKTESLRSLGVISRDEWLDSLVLKRLNDSANGSANTALFVYDEDIPF